jgi:hypothetical protein
MIGKIRNPKSSRRFSEGFVETLIGSQVPSHRVFCCRSTFDLMDRLICFDRHILAIPPLASLGFHFLAAEEGVVAEAEG